MANKQTALDILFQEIKESKAVMPDALFRYFEMVYNKAKEIESKQNGWNVVKGHEPEPPSGVELLVQSPEGVIHLACWRESYNIFTCQDKRESSKDWKWKEI